MAKNRIVGSAATAVVTVAALCVLASPATALWATAGFGAGNAHARELPTPENVTATCNGSTRVDVGWTAATAAPLIAAFRVERSSESGGSWTTVATTNATTATSYLLADQPGDGKYVYRVVALQQSWDKVSGSSSSRTLSTSLLLIKSCT